MFTSSTKREIRHFHVVVVQWRQRNVPKSVMDVQSCCTYSCFAVLADVAFSSSITLSNISKFFWSWILKNASKYGKGKESRLGFTCSTKIEFRHSHVVVVQWRQRNVHKKRDARVKLLLNLLRTLRSNDADSNDNVKKTIGLISKTTTSFLHDYDVKMPNFAFYGGRKQATTKFYFSFWAWIWSYSFRRVCLHLTK